MSVDQQECQHPAFFHNLCVSCGARVPKAHRAVADEGGDPENPHEKVILSGGNIITLTEKEAEDMKGVYCFV